MKRVCNKYIGFDWLIASFKNIHTCISALTIQSNRQSAFNKGSSSLIDERLSLIHI